MAKQYTLVDMQNSALLYAYENNLNKSSADFYRAYQKGSNSYYNWYISKGNLSSTTTSTFYTAPGTTGANTGAIHCSAEHNGFIYCIGRIDVSNTSVYIYKINTTTKVVTTITTAPSSYSSNGNIQFIFVGNYLYIFYMRYGQYSYFTGSFYIKINLTNDSVVSTSSFLPDSRSYSCVAGVGTNIYVFGVYRDINAQKTSYYTTIYKFDTTTDTLSVCNSTTTASKGVKSFGVIGSDIYIGISNSSTRITTVSKFDTKKDESKVVLEIESPSSNLDFTLNFGYQGKLYGSGYSGGWKFYRIDFDMQPKVVKIDNKILMKVNNKLVKSINGEDVMSGKEQN